MTLGKQMRKIRLSRDMTQQEVGELMGFSEKCSKSVVSNFETGKRIPPKTPFFQFIKAMEMNKSDKSALIQKWEEAVINKSHSK